jgi:hypothetical protein
MEAGSYARSSKGYGQWPDDDSKVEEDLIPVARILKSGRGKKRPDKLRGYRAFNQFGSKPPLTTATMPERVAGGNAEHHLARKVRRKRRRLESNPAGTGRDFSVSWEYFLLIFPFVFAMAPHEQNRICLQREIPKGF